jgi:hypothetical protein
MQEVEEGKDRKTKKREAVPQKYGRPAKTVNDREVFSVGDE